MPDVRARQGHDHEQPPMSRKPLQNLALLVVALAVGILGLEAFLRLFPQLLPEEARLRLHWSAIGEGGRDANSQVMTVADPYLGFRYLPNLTGRLTRGDLDFTFTTDDKGFRNSSPLPDEADIVVLGRLDGVRLWRVRRRDMVSSSRHAFPRLYDQ